MRNLESWRQALDVAGIALRRDLSQTARATARALTGGTSPEATVVWKVVNSDIEGRNFRYRYTEYPADTPATPERIWAINLHGYFAGGTMYARESERLATRLGWRVVNPSFPGFGGSDPLEWGELSISALSRFLDTVRSDLGITKFVLLGHSMGGAIAIDYAARNLDDVLGLIYRDGVATPQWQDRNGVTARVLRPAMPDVAPYADLMSAIALDTPDLLMGHLFTTLRALWPDLRSNVKTVTHSIPVGSMLMSLDLTESVRRVNVARVPMLSVWGCFDHVVTTSTADAFADITGSPTQWVIGGHSWMLARPSAQSDVLEYTPAGRAFHDAVRCRAETTHAALTA